MMTKLRQYVDSQDCIVSYLECGSKVSLMSSGLTKCSDSVFSTVTLSRSRLNLLPSHMLSLREEMKKKVHQSWEDNSADR